MVGSLSFREGSRDYRIDPKLLARDLLVELSEDPTDEVAMGQMIKLIEGYFAEGGSQSLSDFASQVASEPWEVHRVSVAVRHIERVVWDHLQMNARVDADSQCPWYVRLFRWF